MIRTVVIGVAVSLALGGAAIAQQPPLPSMTQQTAAIKRTLLQKFEVPGSGYETVVGLAEIVPNVAIGRHTHFGIEAGLVIEGDLTLIVAGQPDRALKAGDSYQVAAGAVHDAKAGPAGAKVVATYVVEKGKPLATPAP